MSNGGTKWASPTEKQKVAQGKVNISMLKYQGYCSK